MLSLTEGQKNMYIRQKTIDLAEFGYKTLTENHVREQLELVLRRETGLSIIGFFIKDDIEKLVKLGAK